MIELNILIWLLAAFFSYIGWLRGWTKEIIALAGIVLGLFTMFQFDTLIRFSLFDELPVDQLFYVQSALFLLIVFFAYQTRALGDRRRSAENRDELQSKTLGAIVGFVNGYLVGGTLWYFLEINNYPLAPFVTQPPAGTASAAMVDRLPITVLTQNSANGDLLSLSVVILFVVVLFII